MALKRKIIVLLLVAELAVAALAAEPLVVLTAADTPPLSYLDQETGEVVGIEVDVLKAVAAKLGRKLEMRVVTFPEILPAVSAGLADVGASGITITDGRRRTVDFSIPYITSGGMFLYRATDAMPTMITAEELKVATMDSSSYDMFLSLHDLDPVRYELYEEAVKDLKSGVVDAVLYNSCAVRITAGESRGELAYSRLIVRENFGFAVHKGNYELKSAIDETIEAMKGAASRKEGQ